MQVRTAPDIDSIRLAAHRPLLSNGIPIKTLAASGYSSSSSSKSAYCSRREQICKRGISVWTRLDEVVARAHLLLERRHSRLHLVQAHCHNVLARVPVTDILQSYDIVRHGGPSYDLWKVGRENVVEVQRQV